MSGGPASIHGELAVKKVNELIARHHNELRFCHENQANMPDTIQLQLKLIVSPTGTVQTASVPESDAEDGLFEKCLAGAARRWTFPAPKGGGIAVVTYPVRFERLN